MDGAGVLRIRILHFLFVVSRVFSKNTDKIRIGWKLCNGDPIWFV